MINKSAENGLNRHESMKDAYTVCECGHGVKLHDAGFEANLIQCPECFEDVADREEFFKYQDGMEVMSK